jgi:hypothetical protein
MRKKELGLKTALAAYFVRVLSLYSIEVFFNNTMMNTRTNA